MSSMPLTTSTFRSAANNFQRIPAFPAKRRASGADAGVAQSKRDKAFFYGAYEGLRQMLGQTVVELVPGTGCHQVPRAITQA